MSSERVIIPIDCDQTGDSREWSTAQNVRGATRITTLKLFFAAKRLIPAYILSLVCFSFTAIAASAENATESQPQRDLLEQNLLKRARSYLKAGQGVEAIDCANQALRLNPKSERAFVKRAEGYCLTEKFDLAVKDCDQALLLDKNDHDALYRKGCALTGLHRYHDALVVLRQVAKEQPTRVMAFLYMGGCDQALKKYADAMQDYHLFIARANTLSEKQNKTGAFRRCAKCAKQMGRPDLEHTELSAWINFDPNDSEPYKLRAENLVSRKKTEEAADDLKQVLKLDPVDKESAAQLSLLQKNTVEINRPNHKPKS